MPGHRLGQAAMICWGSLSLGIILGCIAFGIVAKITWHSLERDQ
jgi:hypothetical protein